MSSKLKIGVVVQRWFPQVVGGSEGLAYQYCQLLKDQYDVHLITTTAKNTLTWSNELPDGVEDVDGITLHRFHVDIGRTRFWSELHTLLVRQVRALQREPIEYKNDDPFIHWSDSLQEEWLKQQGPHSESLLNYLASNGREYHALIFLTYLYSPTCLGLRVHSAKKSLFVPTLHDEPSAYLSIFYESAKCADAVLWNTQSERDLGVCLWGNLNGGIVSMGIDVDSCFADDESACRTREPFMLYCGRIDEGKGCGELIDFYNSYVKQINGQSPPLKLILTGTLSMKFHPPTGVEYLGFVSEDEKFNLMKRATLFVMPSLNESLSIVTLEAMARKTPLLMSGRNPVFREHKLRSHAGFLYENQEEFISAVKEIEYFTGKSEVEPNTSFYKDRSEFYHSLDLGRSYVIENYHYKNVQKKLIAWCE